jgi:polyribonucleotide nucleotidyltransferase
VARVVDFGAFVNFLGNHDGLCHISELSDERVGKVTDVLNEGDMVKVKVLAIDDRGKVKLSRRAVDQETGEEVEVKPKGAAAGGDADGDGGGRRRRRAG